MSLFFQRLPEFIVHHPLLVAAFVVFLLATFWVEWGDKSGFPGLGVAELVMHANRGDVVLVDIRDSAAFASGHILDAISMPKADLNVEDKRFKKAKAGKAKTLVLVCQQGVSAKAAAKQFKLAGYDVMVLRGGMSAWQKEEMPLVRGV